MRQSSGPTRTLEAAFAQVLRDLRRKRGLSQENLGFESGFHRTYIGLLERGLRCPSLAVVFRLAETLKLSPAQMVARVEKRIKSQKKRQGPSN